MVTCLEMLKQSKRYNIYPPSLASPCGQRRCANRETNPYLMGLKGGKQDLTHPLLSSGTPRYLSNRFHRLSLHASIPTPGERSLRRQWQRNSARFTRDEHPSKIRCNKQAEVSNIYELKPSRAKERGLASCPETRCSTRHSQLRFVRFASKTPCPQPKKIDSSAPPRGKTVTLAMYETPSAPSNSPRNSAIKVEAKKGNFSQNMALKHRQAMGRPKTAQAGSGGDLGNSRGQSATILKRSGLVNPRMATCGATGFRSTSREPEVTAEQNARAAPRTAHPIRRFYRMLHLPSQHAIKAANQLGVKMSDSVGTPTNKSHQTQSFASTHGVSDCCNTAIENTSFAWFKKPKGNPMDPYTGRGYASLDSSILQYHSSDPVLNWRILTWLERVTSNPKIYYGFETDMTDSDNFDED